MDTGPGRKVVTDVVENFPRKPSFLSPERRAERRGSVLSPLEPSLEMRDMKGPERSKHKLIWAIGIIVGILAASFFLAQYFASASIVVTPKQDQRDVDTTMKAYKNPEAPQLLSYELLEVSGEESEVLPALGNKYVERKASGKITVYNDYSKDTLRFVANTRFKSPDGKIYRTYNVIVIPGNGSVEISVVADAPGEEYNIGPAAFTLPGLSGGAMFAKVYGKSTSNMEGGFKGTVKVIADDELSKTRTKLEGVLTQKLLSKLNSDLKDTRVFFPDSYSSSYSFNEFAQSEENDDSHQAVTVSGTLYAVVFDKGNLATVLGRRELAVSAEAGVEINNWQDLSLDLSHYDELNVADELTVRITGPTHFVWQFDEESLKSALLGKPKDSYAKIFLGFPGIDKAEVKIKPFWRKSFPSKGERIKITTKLDQ